MTANNVIASVCLSTLHSQPRETSCVTEETARARFLETAAQVASGTLAPASCEAVRKALVHAHGYQFTSFVFAKSGLQDVSAASKPRPEEKRAKQRHTKAWASLNVPEDKPSYWKQVRSSVCASRELGLCTDARHLSTRARQRVLTLATSNSSTTLRTSVRSTTTSARASRGGRSLRTLSAVALQARRRRGGGRRSSSQALCAQCTHDRAETC